MTKHGRVNGQLIRISPQVSGPISGISVMNNAEIRRGQALLSIEKQPFELAAESARLTLQRALKAFKVDAESVALAKASEVTARVKWAKARQHTERNALLARRGVIDQASLDASQLALISAQTALAESSTALEELHEALGPKAAKNLALNVAMTELNQALLNLSYTDIRAPAAGVVTNITVSAGDYANIGHPLLTYLNTDHLWLTAMVKERSLVYIDKGTLVKIVFEAYPGEIYHGEVTSIGWGTSGNGSLKIDSTTGLFDSPTEIQYPQRFPVNVRFFDIPEDVTLRYGGLATVSFYPRESEFGEVLLDFWTWLWSYISYV
ncbi:HlyD family secretion protein [Enterovibrio calviensis]|uniref:HlyD family secretion protein n=1 Tax=Enterovibrio calviensis TaxID=91359 RepID=UPI000AA29826|nr:efflux RND transporter periplasmic adaptor subunit [Enterovibrio calviensis]